MNRCKRDTLQHLKLDNAVWAARNCICCCCRPSRPLGPLGAFSNEDPAVQHRLFAVRPLAGKLGCPGEHSGGTCTTQCKEFVGCVACMIWDRIESSECGILTCHRTAILIQEEVDSDLSATDQTGCGPRSLMHVFSAGKQKAVATSSKACRRMTSLCNPSFCLVDMGRRSPVQP